MARLKLFQVLFAAGSLLALPSTVGAARFPGNITLTPHNPLPVSSAYHVDACGLRPNTVHAVDTTGPNYFYTRREYTSDASGCVRYDTVSGSLPGQYLIEVQQAKSWRLTVVDQHIFVVQ